MEDTEKKNNVIWALKTGDMDVVSALLVTEQEVNRPLDGGRMPLHIACDFGQTLVVEQLISRGADVNAIDKHGFTPLLTACFEGHCACVKVLLEKGANKNVAGPDGKRPFDVVVDDALKALLE
ncbi:myotrophin [Vanacampus margaritifer]